MTRRAWALEGTRACRATRGLTTKAVCILIMSMIRLLVDGAGGACELDAGWAGLLSEP